MKSERAGKIQMTKLERKYEAARSERNSVFERAREGGWCEEMSKEVEAAEKKMAEISDEMRALSAKAESLGFYVKGRLLRYWDSPTAALIAANID